MELFYEPMTTALGLLGLVAFIASVILLAAVVTWAVVKISPSPASKNPDAT
jgi:hypothetical protein